MDNLNFLVAFLVMVTASVIMATKGGGSMGSYYPSYDYKEYGQPYSAVPIYSPMAVESYAVKLPQYESNYEFEGYAPIQRYVEVQEMSYGGMGGGGKGKGKGKGGGMMMMGGYGMMGGGYGGYMGRRR